MNLVWQRSSLMNYPMSFFVHLLHFCCTVGNTGRNSYWCISSFHFNDFLGYFSYICGPNIERKILWRYLQQKNRWSLIALFALFFFSHLKTSIVNVRFCCQPFRIKELRLHSRLIILKLYSRRTRRNPSLKRQRYDRLHWHRIPREECNARQRAALCIVEYLWERWRETWR